MDTADISLLEVLQNRVCPVDLEATDPLVRQEWEVLHGVVAEAEEAPASVVGEGVTSREVIIVEVVAISVVEEEWIEAVEEDPGTTWVARAEVVQEVEEVSEIVEAEEAVVVAVHRNAVEVLQVPVDHPRDRGSINRLLNLRTAMRLNHPVKVHTEEALAMHMVAVSNSRNSNKQWATAEAMDHKIILSPRTRATKVISSPRITVKQQAIHHRPQPIIGMAEHLPFPLQELSVLVIPTAMAKHHHQITRIRMVYTANRIMVAVLVTKTPSLSDVIKLHIQLFNFIR